MIAAEPHVVVPAAHRLLSVFGLFRLVLVSAVLVCYGIESLPWYEYNEYIPPAGPHSPSATRRASATAFRRPSPTY